MKCQNKPSYEWYTWNLIGAVLRRPCSARVQANWLRAPHATRRESDGVLQGKGRNAPALQSSVDLVVFSRL